VRDRATAPFVLDCGFEFDQYGRPYQGRRPSLAAWPGSVPDVGEITSLFVLTRVPPRGRRATTRRTRQLAVLAGPGLRLPPHHADVAYQVGSGSLCVG
jgi:hypothetical protein